MLDTINREALRCANEIVAEITAFADAHAHLKETQEITDGIRALHFGISYEPKDKGGGCSFDICLAGGGPAVRMIGYRSGRRNHPIGSLIAVQHQHWNVPWTDLCLSIENHSALRWFAWRVCNADPPSRSNTNS